jgi:hypothetical protein
VTLLALLVGAAPAGAETGPLSPAVSLEPNRALFADRIDAVATVVVDDEAVDPAAVHAIAAFGPLDVLSGPTVERSDQGGKAVLRFRWEVACLSQDCVPSVAARPVRLPPLQVTSTGRDGRSIDTTASWPLLSIIGRVSAEQAAAATPPFQLETDLPQPSYRAAPRSLQAGLFVLAAVLAVALLALVGPELLAVRRRREQKRFAALSPLERALLLAREAELRNPADRRKALSLLARVLDGTGGSLTGAASELAWAPPEPSPAQIEAVVDEVEREVGRR